MNAGERESFWKVLKEIKDMDQESFEKLNSAYNLPEQLCRFRSVNESSLQQLQDNKLFFSSADFYDDPFDTYFYINYKGLYEIFDLTIELINKNEEKACSIFGKMLPDIPSEILLSELRKSNVSKALLRDRILNARNLVQKQLYSICFCENPKNETLWLKYADNHKGFLLIYDMYDEDTFLCGSYPACSNCIMFKPHPNIYPVYYTDEKYDATKFTLAVLLQNITPTSVLEKTPYLSEILINAIMWESERISLIKKKCHEYDEEWRMIFSSGGIERPCIKMKPKCVVLGFRMPNFKRRMVISAAKEAGIKDIREIYIDEYDNLAMRAVKTKQICGE